MDWWIDGLMDWVVRGFVATLIEDEEDVMMRSFSLLTSPVAPILTGKAELWDH